MNIGAYDQYGWGNNNWASSPSDESENANVNIGGLYFTIKRDFHNEKISIYYQEGENKKFVVGCDSFRYLRSEIMMVNVSSRVIIYHKGNELPRMHFSASNIDSISLFDLDNTDFKALMEKQEVDDLGEFYTRRSMNYYLFLDDDHVVKRNKMISLLVGLEETEILSSLTCIIRNRRRGILNPDKVHISKFCKEYQYFVIFLLLANQFDPHCAFYRLSKDVLLYEIIFAHFTEYEVFIMLRPQFTVLREMKKYETKQMRIMMKPFNVTSEKITKCLSDIHHKRNLLLSTTYLYDVTWRMKLHLVRLGRNVKFEFLEEYRKIIISSILLCTSITKDEISNIDSIYDDKPNISRENVFFSEILNDHFQFVIIQNIMSTISVMSMKLLHILDDQHFIFEQREFENILFHEEEDSIHFDAQEMVRTVRENLGGLKIDLDSSWGSTPSSEEKTPETTTTKVTNIDTNTSTTETTSGFNYNFSTPESSSLYVFGNDFSTPTTTKEDETDKKFRFSDEFEKLLVSLWGKNWWSNKEKSVKRSRKGIFNFSKLREKVFSPNFCHNIMKILEFHIEHHIFKFSHSQSQTKRAMKKRRKLVNNFLKKKPIRQDGFSPPGFGVHSMIEFFELMSVEELFRSRKEYKNILETIFSFANQKVDFLKKKKEKKENSEKKNQMRGRTRRNNMMFWGAGDFDNNEEDLDGELSVKEYLELGWLLCRDLYRFISASQFKYFMDDSEEEEEEETKSLMRLFISFSFMDRMGVGISSPSFEQTIMEKYDATSLSTDPNKAPIEGKLYTLISRYHPHLPVFSKDEKILNFYSSNIINNIEKSERKRRKDSDFEVLPLTLQIMKSGYNHVFLKSKAFFDYVLSLCQFYSSGQKKPLVEQTSLDYSSKTTLPFVRRGWEDQCFLKTKNQKLMTSMMTQQPSDNNNNNNDMFSFKYGEENIMKKQQEEEEEEKEELDEEEEKMLEKTRRKKQFLKKCKEHEVGEDEYLKLGDHLTSLLVLLMPSDEEIYSTKKNYFSQIQEVQEVIKNNSIRSNNAADSSISFFLARRLEDIIRQTASEIYYQRTLEFRKEQLDVNNMCIIISKLFQVQLQEIKLMEPTTNEEEEKVQSFTRRFKMFKSNERLIVHMINSFLNPRIYCSEPSNFQAFFRLVLSLLSTLLREGLAGQEGGSEETTSSWKKHLETKKLKEDLNEIKYWINVVSFILRNFENIQNSRTILYQEQEDEGDEEDRAEKLLFNNEVSKQLEATEIILNRIHKFYKITSHQSNKLIERFFQILSSIEDHEITPSFCSFWMFNSEHEKLTPELLNLKLPNLISHPDHNKISTSNNNSTMEDNLEIFQVNPVYFKNYEQQVLVHNIIEIYRQFFILSSSSTTMMGQPREQQKINDMNFFCVLMKMLSKGLFYSEIVEYLGSPSFNHSFSNLLLFNSFFFQKEGIGVVPKNSKHTGKKEEEEEYDFINNFDISFSENLKNGLLEEKKSSEEESLLQKEERLILCKIHEKMSRYLVDIVDRTFFSVGGGTFNIYNTGDGDVRILRMLTVVCKIFADCIRVSFSLYARDEENNFFDVAFKSCVDRMSKMMNLLISRSIKNYEKANTSTITEEEEVKEEKEEKEEQELINPLEWNEKQQRQVELLKKRTETAHLLKTGAGKNNEDRSRIFYDSEDYQLIKSICELYFQTFCFRIRNNQQLSSDSISLLFQLLVPKLSRMKRLSEFMSGYNNSLQFFKNIEDLISQIFENEDKMEMIKSFGDPKARRMVINTLLDKKQSEIFKWFPNSILGILKLYFCSMSEGVFNFLKHSSILTSCYEKYNTEEVNIINKKNLRLPGRRRNKRHGRSNILMNNNLLPDKFVKCEEEEFLFLYTFSFLILSGQEIRQRGVEISIFELQQQGKQEQQQKEHKPLLASLEPSVEKNKILYLLFRKFFLFLVSFKHGKKKKGSRNIPTFGPRSTLDYKRKEIFFKKKEEEEENESESEIMNLEEKNKDLERKLKESGLTSSSSSSFSFSSDSTTTTTTGIKKKMYDDSFQVIQNLRKGRESKFVFVLDVMTRILELIDDHNNTNNNNNIFHHGILTMVYGIYEKTDPENDYSELEVSSLKCFFTTFLKRCGDGCDSKEMKDIQRLMSSIDDDEFGDSKRESSVVVEEEEEVDPSMFSASSFFSPSSSSSWEDGMTGGGSQQQQQQQQQQQFDVSFGNWGEEANNDDQGGFGTWDNNNDNNNNNTNTSGWSQYGHGSNTGWGSNF